MDPLILDIDGASNVYNGVARVDLRAVEESIRYGCTWPRWRIFERELFSVTQSKPSIFFLGSGDLHHVSYGLIKNIPSTEPFEVLVIDNHPDNMRFPFGIHCGSWVYHAAKLPQVKRVTVVGITSEDIRGWHVFENHLSPLLRGKIQCVALHSEGASGRKFYLPGVTQLPENQVISHLQKLYVNSSSRIYLSIDKDALSPSVITTDWDQGIMERETVLAIARLAAPKLIGADVTGELSPYRFSTGWKKLLTYFDGRAPLAHTDVALEKQKQTDLNIAIVEAINSARHS